MSINKGKVIWFLICPFLLVLFLIYFICVAYFYDPLQLFGEKYPKYYHKNIRLSAKRVIDNYDFNSVILGTSLFLSSNPMELSNGKYINITIPGATMLERKIVLEYLLLKYSSIKNVIYSFDIFADGYGTYGKDFSSLYGNNLGYIDKLQFYLNGHVSYICFFKLSVNDDCVGLNHDYYSVQHKSKNIDYILNLDDFQNQDLKYDSYIERKIIQDNLVDIVKRFKNTTFHIIMPPYHTLYYKQNFIYFDLYKFGVSVLGEYDNVKLYFFGNEDFTDNINNYQDDKVHFRPWINSRINKAINEGTNIITKENMDEYFDKFINKVENYNIKAYEEALKLDIRE